MGVLTIILFSTKVGFTLLKSIALLFKQKIRARNISATLFYVIEVLLGIALVGLLTYDIWVSRAILLRSSISIRVISVIILATEVLANLTEGALLWWRCRDCMTIAAAQRRMQKNMAKLIAFIVGIVVVSYALIEEIRGKVAILRLTILSVMLFSSLLIGAMSLVLSSKPRFRANLSLLVSIGGAVISLGLFFGYKKIPPANDKVPVPVSNSAQAAMFGAAIGSGLTSATAWGVTDFSISGCVDCEHSRVFETIAFAVTGPILTLAVNRSAMTGITEIVFTILPQVLAIALPLIIGYIGTLFLKGRRDDDDQDFKPKKRMEAV